MKFMRILAVLMAAMLCLTACSMIEEEQESAPTAAPTAAPAAPEVTYDIAPGVASNDSLLIKSLNMPYENWMTEDMYGVFAATFFMDMSYVDAFGLIDLSTEQGIPTVYVGELEGDNYGNGMNLSLFFTNPETAAVTMVNATVYLKTGMFEGYVQENITDIAATMESLVTDGTLKVYHEITTDEFMSAYAGIAQMLSEMTVAQ